MRANRWFLVIWLIFLLNIAVFSASLMQRNLPTIIEKIKPSVVVILIYNEKGNLIANGSGFIINKNGDVITNRHVLKDATRAEVKTAEGKIYNIINVIAEDKEGDLIQVSVNIPKTEVQPLSINPSIPKVGERLIVIGSPLGLELTVADGIVSAIREIPKFGKIIQMTAPLSPGSSGSPVVNIEGEVIGVASYQIVEGQNLNFAIPCERVAKLVPTEEHHLTYWKAGRTKKKLALAEEFYNKGLAFLWAEDYKKALSQFEEAVKNSPNFAKAYFQIGFCSNELGRNNKALEAFKHTIRINPNDDVAHYNLGVVYQDLGRYDEAVDAYKHAIRINPDDSEAYYQNLGISYFLLKRFVDSIRALKETIRINPNIAEVYITLGGDYRYLRRYADAEEAFKKAIRINPDISSAHVGLGILYQDQGGYLEAVGAYKQAIRINPENVNAHALLGINYVLIGDKSSALEQYKILKKLDPDKANILFKAIYK